MTSKHTKFRVGLPSQPVPYFPHWVSAQQGVTRLDTKAAWVTTQAHLKRTKAVQNVPSGSRHTRTTTTLKSHQIQAKTILQLSKPRHQYYEVKTINKTSHKALTQSLSREPQLTFPTRPNHKNTKPGYQVTFYNKNIVSPLLLVKISSKPTKENHVPTIWVTNRDTRVETRGHSPSK